MLSVRVLVWPYFDMLPSQMAGHLILIGESPKGSRSSRARGSWWWGHGQRDHLIHIFSKLLFSSWSTKDVPKEKVQVHHSWTYLFLMSKLCCDGYGLAGLYSPRTQPWVDTWIQLRHTTHHDLNLHWVLTLESASHKVQWCTKWHWPQTWCLNFENTCEWQRNSK